MDYKASPCGLADAHAPSPVGPHRGSTDGGAKMHLEQSGKEKILFFLIPRGVMPC